MPCNCPPCTLDTDALLAKVRELLYAKLAARCNRSIRHHNYDNKDYPQGPAQWWFDTDKTIRHGLGTGASMSFNPATATLTVTLSYGV